MLRSSLLFGDFLAPTDNALADAALAPALRDASQYHRPPPAPLVVAEGVDALVSSPVLARSYRSYAWVQALGAGTPRLWQIDDLVRRADSARTELEAQSPSWALTVPAEELREAEHVATVAGRRLLLVGGEAAALLVAFAVLAAGALRRDLAAARRRLTWHGARRWQGALLTGTECAAVGFGGALAGWIVGGVGGAVAAAVADAPVGAVLAESVLSPTGLLLGLATAVVAAAVIAVTVSLAPGRRGRLGTLDLAAVVALLAALAIVLSGAVDADDLASGGAAPATLLVLPGLVAFAVAVGASRLLPAVGRLAARRGRRGSARLAGVSLARSAGAAGIAAAFLALAVALAGLAETYRSTLQTGERDQAAFAVPTDVIVREDLRSLVPVLRAAPLERYAAIPGVEAVHPVTRLTASAGPAASVSGVTVLGVPPAALRAEPLWRDDWGATRDAVAKAVERNGSDELRGPILPGSDLALEVGPRASVVPRAPRAARRPVPDTRPGRRRPRRALGPPGTSPARCAGRRGSSALELVAPRLHRPRRRRRDRAARSDGTPRGGRLAGRLDRRGWGHRGGPLGRSRHAGDVRRHRSARRPASARGSRRTTIRRPPS